MHDPRIGRFFSVDPLSKKYPYYSPYAFSGNRVIDAIELEGLEPATIINNGKLSATTKQFMQPALNVCRASLDDVTWYTQSNYKGGAIDRQIVSQALSTHGAITLNDKQIVYRDEYASRSAAYFVPLIAHEHTHVIQYQQYGRIGFYAKYGIEVANKGYRGAYLEDFAYRMGDAMDDWLSKNQNVLSLMNTDLTNLGASDRNDILKQLNQEGKRFRYEVGIDTEIGFWSDAAKDLLNSVGDDIDRAPPMFKQLYNSYRQTITDLHVEKQKLGNELKK